MGNGATCMAGGEVQQKDQRTSRGSASTERRDARSGRTTPSSKLSQHGRRTLFQHLLENARHDPPDRTPTPHRGLSQRHVRGLHAATPSSATTSTTAGTPSPPSLVETLPTRGQRLGQRSSSTDLMKTSSKDLKRKQATHDAPHRGSSTSSMKEGRRAPGLTSSSPSGAASSPAVPARPRSGTSPALRSPRNTTANEDTSAGLEFSYDIAADYILASGDHTPALSTGVEDSGSLHVSLLPDSESGGTSRGSSTTPRASGTARTSGAVDGSTSPSLLYINRMSCTPEVTPMGNVRVASPFYYRGASTTPQLYSPRLSEGKESDAASRESDGEATSIVKQRPSSTNRAATPLVNGLSSKKSGRANLSPRGNGSTPAGSRESQTPAIEDFYDLYFNNCGLSPFTSPQSQMTVAATPIATSENNSTGNPGSRGNVNAKGKTDSGQEEQPLSQLQSGKAKSKSSWKSSANAAGWPDPPRDHVVTAYGGPPRPGSSDTVNTLPHHSQVPRDTPTPRKSTLPHDVATARSMAENSDKSRPTSGRSPAAAADTPTKGNRDLLESSMTQSMPDLRSSHRVDSILQSSSRFRDRDTPDGGLLDSKAGSVSFVLAEDQAQLAIVSSQRMSLAMPRSAMGASIMQNDDMAMRSGRRM